MPTPPIIGLLGPAGSGKTTLSSELLKLHPTAIKLSFAAPLRDMLVALGVQREWMASKKLDPIPWLGNHTPRYLLRTLGTEWGRNMVSDTIWADALVREANSKNAPVIVDDIRFDNEAKVLRQHGALLLLMHCDGRGFNYAHASEEGLSDWGLVHGVVHQQEGEILIGSMAKPFLPKRPWWARPGLRWVRRWRKEKPPLDRVSFAPIGPTAKRVSQFWAACCSLGSNPNSYLLQCESPSSPPSPSDS